MSAVALADDGHVVAGHCCSDEGYMRHDLGLDGSPWKHDHYDAHFGVGNWELEWVPNLKEHSGLNAAMALNAALTPEELAKDSAVRPSVTVTFTDGSCTKVEL